MIFIFQTNTQFIPVAGITEFPVPLSRLIESSITSIKEDKDGNLWIGTWGTGIIRFDKTTFRYHHFIENSGNEYSLRINKNNVKSIFIDSDGNIWIASMLDGLKKMIYDKATDKIHYVRYSLMNGRFNQVTSIAEDKDKNLFIGTFDGGLLRLSREQKNKYKRYDNINVTS